MKREIAPGQKIFVDNLVKFSIFFRDPRIFNYSLLELYIHLRYGDSKTPLSIPASLASKCKLWMQECQPIIAKYELKAYEKIAWVYKNLPTDINYYDYKTLKRRAPWCFRYTEDLELHRQLVYESFEKWCFSRTIDKYIIIRNPLRFLLLQDCSALSNLLTPYFSSRLGESWRRAWSRSSTNTDDVINCLREHGQDEIAALYRQYGEGAFVVQALIKAGTGRLQPYDEAWMWQRWSYQIGRTNGKILVDGRFEEMYGWVDRNVNWNRRYNNIHMLIFPAIVGKEPLQILLLVKQINNILLKSFPNWHQRNFGIKEIKPEILMENIKYSDPWREWGIEIDEIEHKYGKNRKDAELLIATIKNKQWPQDYALQALWNRMDEFTRMYLILRACDIVVFENRVADITYPQPTIEGTTQEEVGALIESLVALQRLAEIKTAYSEDQERYHSMINYFHEGRSGDGNLSARILKTEESEILLEECIKLIEDDQSDDYGYGVKVSKTAMDKFVRFCELLSKPENHVLVPTGQYIDRAVNTRTIADMTHEMSQELTGLAPYTAYAKFIQEEDGKKSVWKGKIKTSPLLPKSKLDITTRDIIENTHILYCKERTLIEEETRLRQENWRKQSGDNPPPTYSRGLQVEPEEPPSTSY